MPPKKQHKGDSDGDKTDMVLEYMKKSNRPYSANDISSQLHGLVTSAAAKKILNELADEEKLIRKVYGKQAIFYANQSEIDVPSVEEAEEENETIEKLNERLISLKDTNKELSIKLNSLNNSLTDDQIRERIAELTVKTRENNDRLEQLRTGEVVTEEEKNRVESEHKKMIKYWAVRKKIFKDIHNTLAEGYPGKLSALYEDLGIETDQDANIDESILENI